MKLKEWFNVKFWPGDAIARTIEPLLPLVRIGAINGLGCRVTIQPLAAGTQNHAFTSSNADSTHNFVFWVSKPAGYHGQDLSGMDPGDMMPGV